MSIIAQILGLGVGAGLGYIEDDGPPSIVGVDPGVMGYIDYAAHEPDRRIAVVVSLSPSIDGVLAGDARRQFREAIKSGLGVGTAQVSGRRDWILTVPLYALAALASQPEIAGIRLHEETPPPPLPPTGFAPGIGAPGGALNLLPVAAIGIGAFLLIRRFA